ncbi:MAG: hypothetical protein JWP21_2745 [Tardiphaga sp.]|jgi:hypothetical protein|nr:hypothetical protein [Tardiphaga sp.]
MRSNKRLHKLSIAELVEQFLTMALEQDDVLLKGRPISIYSRLFHQMNAIAQELKSRAGDQRIALLPLLDIDNPQVKLMAASELMQVAPKPARKVLEDLKQTNIFPHSANASMLLKELDGGLHSSD